MIKGLFDKGHPTISGALFIDSLGYAREVNFLADTGSYITVLHPSDGNAGNLPYPTLPSIAPVTTSNGIGAKARSHIVPADLYLQRVDGYWDLVSLDIAIAVPSPHNRTFPSLLGWDVLKHYCLVSNRPNNVVQLRHCPLPAKCSYDCP